MLIRQVLFSGTTSQTPRLFDPYICTQKLTTMMTLCFFLLGYHAAIFSNTQAADFKNRFLKIKTNDNDIVSTREVADRKYKMYIINNVLAQSSSFMAVGDFNKGEKSYLFFTEPYTGLHRLDAYIVNDLNDLSKFKSWHQKYYSNYVLQLF